MRKLPFVDKLRGSTTVTPALSQTADEGFAEPGSIGVTPAALQLAKDFGKSVAAVSRDHVVAFHWAEAITYRSGPGAEPEDLGACLTLGAFKRSEIPPGYTQIVEGLEFAIHVPREIWMESVERLIDLDAARPFNLALR